MRNVRSIAFVSAIMACGVLLTVSFMPAFAQQTEAAKPPIKIGAIFAVTGSASWLGEPEKNSAIMLVDEINKAGGIQGRKIELIVEDTEGNETKAVNAVNKLITRDKVIAIIGPSRTGPTMAVIPIVERYKIPLLSCAAAAAITEPVKPFVFKTPQKDSDAAIRIFEHINTKGYKRIAIITGTTSFGDQGRQQLKKLAPDYGLEIVADETYGPQDTDMTAQLMKIKAANPEALVNWSIVPGQSIIPKNMQQLEIKIPLYQSHGFGNIRYLEAAGEAGEGLIFPAGRALAVDTVPDDHPQKKILVQYKTKYEERFKEPVSAFGGYAYDAMLIIAEALKRIEGEITAENLRDEIEKTRDFVGVTGIFNMTPEDHTGLTKDSFELLTIKGGKFVVLQE